MCLERMSNLRGSNRRLYSEDSSGCPTTRQETIRGHRRCAKYWVVAQVILHQVILHNVSQSDVFIS